MKRLLVRMSALTVIAVLALIAIAQAQRGAQKRGLAENAEAPRAQPTLPDAELMPIKIPPSDDQYADTGPSLEVPPDSDEVFDSSHGAELAADDGRALSDSNRFGSAAAPGREPRALPEEPASSDPFGFSASAASHETSQEDNTPRYDQPTGGQPPDPDEAPPGLPLDARGPPPATHRFGAQPYGSGDRGITFGDEPTDEDETTSGAEQPANITSVVDGDFGVETEPAGGDFAPGYGNGPAEEPGLRRTHADLGPKEPLDLGMSSHDLEALRRDTGSVVATDIEGEQGGGEPGAANLEGPQTPTLVIEKLAPAEIQVGKPATFQVRVRNVGQVPAHRVLVRDEVPQGTRLIPSTASRGVLAADGTLLWELGTLNPGQEAIASMEVMPIAEGEIGSVATVIFQAEASVRTVSTQPRLLLEISAPPTVMIGENVTLSVRVSNPGTGAATNVILEEDVPRGLTHEKGTALELSIGTLKPGETRELPLTLTAEQAGRIENVLVVRGDAGLVAEDRVLLEVIAPQLKLEVAGPKLRYLERPATYKVSVSNPGTATAKDIELVAHLPRGLKFVSTNNAGQYDAKDHAVFWSLAELPPSETGLVQVTTMPIETGPQKIRIEGRASMGLSDVTEQSVLVEGLAALLFEVADTNDPIEVNNEATYEVRVVNQGSKTATNIRIEVFAPADMRPIDGNGPTRAVINGQQILFEPLPRLEPKADSLFKFRLMGVRPGDQRVRVQLRSDEMTTPVTEEESTRVYEDR